MSNANPLTRYHYNQTTRKAVAIFGNLFNRLYVSRNDGKGNYKHERVPLAYSPREKFLSRIREQSKIDDKRIAIRLPRMAFEISSFAYDSN
ncbi:MAG: tail sheath stabilizer and completion protein, partial [Opitutales bacterium]|nr:tail sheath stabilizer and completion protein [Opitutales bacterium]